MAGKTSDTDKSGDRIAKVIARAGLASRREAEQWIADGRVTVNGAVVTSPALDISAKDRVTVDGKPLPTRERTRLFLYYKPSGLVTTNRDPEGRPTIYDSLPRNLPRLVSVGRLDLSTEGLLLLTNDGGLARVLELPETGWLRRYRVRAHGSVTQPVLDGLRGGITIDGIHYGSIEATLDRSQGANVWLTFAIREGKNREVRNVLDHLGLQVNRLIRVSFGPFQLGELKDGEIEEVRSRVLRDQLGERVIAQAGADFSAPITERAEPKASPSKERAMDRRPPRDEEPRGRPPRRSDSGDQRRDQRSRPDSRKPAESRTPDSRPPRPERSRAGRPASRTQEAREERPHRGKAAGSGGARSGRESESFKGRPRFDKGDARSDRSGKPFSPRPRSEGPASGRTRSDRNETPTQADARPPRKTYKTYFSAPREEIDPSRSYGARRDQDDKAPRTSRKGKPIEVKRRRSDERIGGPERARQEQKRRGRRPWHGKERDR